MCLEWDSETWCSDRVKRYEGREVVVMSTMWRGATYGLVNEAPHPPVGESCNNGGGIDHRICSLLFPFFGRLQVFGW